MVTGSGKSVLSWLRREARTGRIGVICGPRGVGKSSVVERWLEEDDVAGALHLDFESSTMRNVKNAEDVLAGLKAVLPRRGTRKTVLVLDELTELLDFERLMARLVALGRFKIIVVSSNRRFFTDKVRKLLAGNQSVCRVYPGEVARRTEYEHRGVWGEIFLKDVLGGHLLGDAVAMERLAGFLYDHRGELWSQRRISQFFEIDGRTLSGGTVGTYLGMLRDSYLFDDVPAYDVDLHQTMNVGVRWFVSDPDLVAWRFGVSPEADDERSAYNASYLRLRTSCGKVCALAGVRDDFADFVTFDSIGNPAVVEWSKC